MADADGGGNINQSFDGSARDRQLGCSFDMSGRAAVPVPLPPSSVRRTATFATPPHRDGSGSGVDFPGPSYLMPAGAVECRRHSALMLAQGIERLKDAERSELLVGLAAQDIPGLEIALECANSRASPAPSEPDEEMTAERQSQGSPLGPPLRQPSVRSVGLVDFEPRRSNTCVSFAGGDGGSGGAHAVGSMIWRTTALVQTARQLAFFRFAVAWIVSVSMLVGLLIWAVEGGDVPFVDTLFVATNAVTCTGLASFDLTKASKYSVALVAAGMQLGSSTLLSLVPVFARVHYLKKTLPKPSSGVVSYDLKNYQRVPQTLVEYKALLILLRLVILYQVVVYVLFGGLMLVYFAANRSARHTVTSSETGAGTGVVQWVVFHTISAYNNAGFSTMPDSMGQLVAHPFVLMCIMLLVLAGNVLLPVFVRWSVVFLNARSPKDSSRKIWCRYLLLNGRTLYTGIFGSQQTWVLLVVQFLLILYQIMVTLIVSWNDPAFSSFTDAEKITVAWFEAINTRHAGMTTITLGLDPGDDRGRVSPATIVTYLMMMFLAPVPFLAVLHGTMPKVHAEEARQRLRDRGTMSPIAASRDLSLQLAASQLAGLVSPQADPGDDADNMLYYIDCRALLMTRYPDSRVPWRERVSVRARAAGFHLKLLAYKFANGRLMRDLAFLWFAWFLIAWIQGRTEQGIQHQLFILFELVTAYGNVGLSLGSTRSPGNPQYCGYCSFAGDLGTTAKVVLMAVEVLGRTRELPQRIDGALSVQTAPEEDAMMNRRYHQRRSLEPHRRKSLWERLGGLLPGSRRQSEASALLLDSPRTLPRKLSTDDDEPVQRRDPTVRIAEDA